MLSKSFLEHFLRCGWSTIILPFSPYYIDLVQTHDHIEMVTTWRLR